jgi:hypothetical protein
MLGLDTEIQCAVLGLTLGLPSRCICPAPFEYQSPVLAVTLCEWCGGLVETRQERVERGSDSGPRASKTYPDPARPPASGGSPINFKSDESERANG